MSKVLLGDWCHPDDEPSPPQTTPATILAHKRSPPVPELQSPEVPAELTYSVRRSPRARRVRVSVDPHAGVEVVLPARAPARAAAAAVAELRPWIERRLREARTVRER